MPYYYNPRTDERCADCDCYQPGSPYNGWCKQTGKAKMASSRCDTGEFREKKEEYYHDEF